jgi:hypothetical protein
MISLACLKQRSARCLVFYVYIFLGYSLGSISHLRPDETLRLAEQIGEGQEEEESDVAEGEDEVPDALSSANPPFY